MHRPTAVLAALLALAPIAACNGNGQQDGGGTGGHAGTGGGGAGGAQSSGGASTQGGVTGSGGRSSTTSATSGGGGAGALGGAAGFGGSATGGVSGAGGAGGETADAGQDAGQADRPAPPEDAASTDLGKDAPDDAAGRDGPAADRWSSDVPASEVPASGVFKPAFILGADVTITVEDEYWGATYTDNGQAKSLEQILKDHGFNFIRIGTFVDPSASDGYATGKPEAFRDLAHTMALAKRVKKIGLGFMLDFHYSDTWASPSAQTTPLAWAGQSLSALATKMHDYTKDAVTQLKAQGAMPDMVSVGNEITNGMLWDTGRISNSNFASFATLLKAGVQAVREVDPNIVIVMHIEKCNNVTTTKWWLDGVLGQGVSFDVLGQSCYANAPNGVAGFHGTPADWKAAFNQLVTAYPSLKFLIAEYSAEQRGAGDVMFGLPDKRGLGTINWDPTRSYETLPNDPLFSTNGAWNRYVAIPEKMALYDKMAQDYGI